MARLAAGLHRTVERAKQWGTWIALGAFAVVYLLLLLDLVQSPELLIGLGVIVALGAIALISDTWARVKALDGPPGATDQLLSLASVYEELTERLEPYGTKMHLEVDHLGLSLSLAEEYFNEFWRSYRTRVAEFDLRVLVISGEADRLPADAPEEVKRWCSDAALALPGVRRSLEVLSCGMTEAGKRHRIRLKSYDRVPTIHGFAVRRPIERHYFSFCRWQRDKYDWGGFAYHVVPGKPEDAATGDLVSIFDGLFAHLWKRGSLIQEWPTAP